MKTVEKSWDARRDLRNYLARLAGRTRGHFCSASLIDLRFAAHANADETLKIVADLEASGEIIPEVRNVEGKEIRGWVVYPATNKSRRVKSGYTAADNAFLQACGIAPMDWSVEAASA